MQPTPGEPQQQWRTTRARRAEVAEAVAALHAGVAHRRDLREGGLTRFDVRSEIAAGRWRAAGKHTVIIGTGDLGDEAQLWRAVWESGSGAVLDGTAALVAGGLKRFRPDHIDVSVPAGNRHHRIEGVRLHRPRKVGPAIGVGVPRVRPEIAALRAALWARSDRQAALIVCLVVQQRIVRPERLHAAWEGLPPRQRRPFVGTVIGDVCNGAHSLGELDFAGLCREHGIPDPTRQAVRTVSGGRVYLDVAWEDVGLVVEIDGGHHALALSPVDDALRQNDVVLDGQPVLRIPVLGLRLCPEKFMAQVVRGHQMLRAA